MNSEDKLNKKIIVLEERLKYTAMTLRRVSREVDDYREGNTKLMDLIFLRLRALEISDAKYYWVPILVTGLVGSVMLYGWEQLKG